MEFDVANNPDQGVSFTFDAPVTASAGALAAIARVDHHLVVQVPRAGDTPVDEAVMAVRVRVDAAGNLRGVLPAASATTKRLFIGSHLDTVIDAGYAR